ncbi:MAG: NAD-dependent epimerase/dehydratase family protein [Chloroflexi bacterium]|nr:MAG: NAD-dependent epimerase/dehydratase family protein [Chloroflexota bacterium]
MILVTGATGFIGRHLVARLLADGYPVRCLLPENETQHLPWEATPDIIEGDVLDEETLFRAASGVYTIIHLRNAMWWGRPRDLERIELFGTRNLLTAARAARVGRIITLSHLGAEPGSAYPLLSIKGLVENDIRNSGLAYTIIRSGLVFGQDDSFVNNIAMMLRMNPFVYLMPGRGEIVLHPIYIDDIVQVLIKSLETIETVDETIEVGGPEYITLIDLIRTVMRVSGAYRAIIPIPPYMLRWLTAFYNRVVLRAVVTSQWLDILAANRTAPLGNTFNYFGFQPRRFEDTIATYMPNKHYFASLLRYSFHRRPKRI